MGGAFTVRGVVDVDRVDADEGRLAGGEPGRAVAREVVRVFGVLRCAEPRVVACVQEYRLPADVRRRQGADADLALARAGDPDDDGGQSGGAGQRDGGQVGAVGEAVVGRVEVGSGIADHGEPVDGELRARGVLRTGGFPGQVRGDRWTGKPRVGDHAWPDHVAELN